MQRQAAEVQTIYAELLEQLAAYEAQRAIGHLPGSFVTKTLKGHDYYYFQYLSPEEPSGRSTSAGGTLRLTPLCEASRTRARTSPRTRRRFGDSARCCERAVR